MIYFIGSRSSEESESEKVGVIHSIGNKKQKRLPTAVPN